MTQICLLLSEYSTLESDPSSEEVLRDETARFGKEKKRLLWIRLNLCAGGFPSLRVTPVGSFSRSVAVMEVAQVLAPMLLFVGNAVCGILAHWLHLRLDAKQRHPR